MISVRVPLGERSYDVLVGHGTTREVGRLLPGTARRAAIVTQAGLGAAVEVAGQLGIEHRFFHIGHGEAHKSLATVEELCRGFAMMGLTRNDAVVAVGGGMVTDVAGFAAAVWHRGVAVVHVSTTLLGMVDAAVGGKTGVNLPEGKNLVGAFWQPAAVVCDLDHLASLPDRELRCGRGEMAKYHFLTGDDLLALDLPERIARCVGIKAEVVAADEREGGRRALLNYGHTLAHALETETDHAMAHGEAVAVGLVYGAHLAHVLGRIDAAAVRRHYEVVAGEYGLDTSLPQGVDPQRLVELMARDKKALESLTFVLDGPHGVEVVPGVPARAALDALSALAASGR